MTQKILMLLFLVSQTAFAKSAPIDQQSAPNPAEQGQKQEQPLGPPLEQSGEQTGDQSQEKTEENLLPIEAMTARSIGLVKRSAVFEWRESSVIVDFNFGQPIEYNNFNSKTFGLDLRFPQSSSYIRLGISKTIVTDSKTSRDLRATPYYQAGRATRWELSPAFELTIHEGIGNQLFSVIPPSQFVLAAVLEFNIAFYKTNDPLFIKRVASTRISGDEEESGYSGAPQSLKLSRARHDLGVGLQWDNYFASGFKWNYRALFHYAPLAGSHGSELKHWISFAIGAGYAF